MSKVPLSTAIDREVKEAASAYCKRHGLKLHYFIEQAILEQIEDEIDLEAYRQRKDEETLPFAEVVKNRKSRRK